MVPRQGSAATGRRSCAHEQGREAAVLQRDEQQALLVGTELEGRYRIRRVLGRGGFALTYLASDARVPNRQVAIKEYLPGSLARVGSDGAVTAYRRGSGPADPASEFERGKRSFLSEAAALSAVRHARVVRVSDRFEAHGTAYLVLDYEQGPTLEEALTQWWSAGQRPTSAWVQQLATQLLEALVAVHAAGVLHRDLKPSNIILRTPSTPVPPGVVAPLEVVLIDFGAARSEVLTRTLGSSAVVSEGYSAPEQYHDGRGAPSSERRSDLYALGATLYQVMTGAMPMSSTARLSQVHEHERDPLPPARERAAGGYPTELLELVDRMLSLRIRDRPESAEAALRALRPTPAPRTAEPTQRVEPGARFPDPEVSASPEWRPPGAASPGLPLRVLAVLAGMGLLVGAVLWSSRQSSGPPVEVVRPVSPPSASPGLLAGPAPAPAPSAAASAPIPPPAKTRDGPVLVPVGGALPGVGVPFRHALRGGGEGPEMVVLPSGRFRLGSPETEKERRLDEGPVREVTIGSFALGVAELTFADWDLCVSRGGCEGYKPEDGGWGRGTRPVINVSWEDAQKYLAWLRGETGGGYRLPSESEWEYAARAGTTTAYWWGNEIDRSRASYGTEECCSGKAEGADRWEYTSPVKSFPANPWGLYDTSGNVWERVQDCYVDSYAGVPADGRAVEKADCEEDERVKRGGSWFDGPAGLRSATRAGTLPANRRIGKLGLRVANTGFRLALDR